MPITRGEFDTEKLFWWRKILGTFLPLKLSWYIGNLLANIFYFLSWLCRYVADHVASSVLRNNPKVRQAIKAKYGSPSRG